MAGKYGEKTNKWLLPAVLLLVLLLVLAGILAARFLPEKTGEENLIKVETGFCDLYYPSQWQSYMRIRQENNTVTFQAEIPGHEIMPLFDVCFDSDQGSYFGTILASDGREVRVSISIYPHEPNEQWPEEDLNVLYEMQECVNQLCEKLPLADAAPGSQSEPAEKDLEISTPYGQLKYPGKWEPYLRTHVESEALCVVEFYAKVGEHPEMHLFDVVLGESETGEIVLRGEDGTLYAMDLKFYLEELDASWTDQEADIVYGMMDDANYLLQSFRLDNTENDN